MWDVIWTLCRVQAICSQITARPWETGISGQEALFHRRIDSFTDTNEIAGEARVLFNASYRHFGGVLSDLAFDWCLA